MANEERKIRYGIKGKLISAIAMLLVAVIMTVSSTYAWFTLSTAPEVTGISTAVGANGALEMFLLTGPTADGLTDVFGDKNTTWGNLVDLKDNAIYGTNLISLYPSQLDVESFPGKINPSSPLQFPNYGADGRLNGEFGSTMLSGGKRADGSSTLDGFVKNDLWGFRAVGTTSGLSDREIALRSATANVNIYATQAKGKAELSLTEHGSTLADMAIQKVARPEEPTFAVKHYNAVAGMIARLEEALAVLDEAYQQAILAWAASGATTANDTVYNAVKSIVGADATYKNIDEVITAVNGKFAEWNAIPEVVELGVALALPEWIVGTPADGENAPTALEQYAVMQTNVELAKTRLVALLTEQNSTETEGVRTPNSGAEFSYSDLSHALQPLVNMSDLKVNGFSLSEKDSIMQSAADTKSVVVSMVTGTGVYGDMADQAGNYKASIKVDIGALVGANLLYDAEMRTVTSVNPTYLQRIIDNATRNPAPGAVADETPFSEYYGYIVDLAFRTNAAASNLLLQQTAIDRIYEDNNNEQTMGHGSTMVFSSPSTGFSTDKVKGLMEHIRIIFFNPVATDGACTIYAYAKLDVANATVSNGEVTAPMYLYETVDNACRYTGTLNRTVHLKDGKYYWDEAGTMPATGVTSDKVEDGKVAIVNPVLYKVVTTTGGETPTTDTKYYYDYYTNDASTLATLPDGATLTQIAKHEVVKTDNVITPLTQGELTKVSALVYLDGKTITNADVAAENAASMTGTANFQFASDANLVPMEYGNLHTPNAPETNS